MQENQIKRMKMAIAAEAVLCMTAFAGIFCKQAENADRGSMQATGSNAWVEEAEGKDYIKWVDFNVSYKALCRAYQWDVDTFGKEIHVDWVELLAYMGARYGGDFSSNDKKVEKDIDKLAKSLLEGENTMEELTKDMKYYAYYEEAYRAVLGGMLGEYEMEKVDEAGNKTWQKVYGLKAYSPIAKGFEYNHYDDFGSSRSYGYKRQHLGHDMMGQVGTPIRMKSRACASE